MESVIGIYIESQCKKLVESCRKDNDQCKDENCDKCMKNFREIYESILKKDSE